MTDKPERLSDLSPPDLDLSPGDQGYDYFADYKNISASMLKTFAKSRRQYDGEFVTCDLPQKPTSRAMDVGSVVHEVCLEGRDLGDVVLRYPSTVYSKTGSLVSARASKFREDNSDYEYFLKDRDMDRVMSIIEALKECEVHKWMIHPNAIREQTLYWTDEDTGLGCRAKPDFMVELDDCVRYFDLKVTTNFTPEDFSNYLGGNRKGSMRGYLQACHYEAGLMSKYKKPASLIYVCVNPESPHQVCVNQISPTSMDMCRSAYRGFMRDLADCYRSGDWSETYEGQINTSVLDQWQVC